MLNPNINYVRNIIKKIEENDGYCPCQVLKDDSSKCPYDIMHLPEKITSTLLCINGKNNKECYCKLYIKEV